eukprot:scaffold7663_cov57-Phaeocystis_antarctica.AAC.2
MRYDHVHPGCDTTHPGGTLRTVAMCTQAASSWAEHILDPTFSGTLTSDDLELKRELLELRRALRADPSSAQAAASSPVKEMLRKLGSPNPDWDVELP